MNKEQYELEMSKRYLIGTGRVVAGLSVLIGGIVIESNVAVSIGWGLFIYGLVKLGTTAWKNLNLRI